MTHGEAGKGDRTRPFNQKRWDEGYDRAFGERPMDIEAPQSIDVDEAMKRLLAVYNAATTGRSLLSNQGQALDGHSELVNYRAILADFCR